MWRLAVALAYPFIASVGKVGEIAVSAYEKKLVSHTPFDEMKSRAQQIYENASPISKLPFYNQETPDSCAPACLRMVFSAFGLEITEAELRNLCDCTIFGTDALMAVDAA